MITVINKWFFPIFAVVTLTAFYIHDNTNISPSGFTLTMILTFIGIAVTERLDQMIKQNDAIVEVIEVTRR